MGRLGLFVGAMKLVSFAVNLVVAGIVTVVAWLVIPGMIASGQLPAEPLGLAAEGFPETVLGLPMAYALGILVLDLLIVFGNGGSSSGGGGAIDGGGGGFGGGGGGDGGE